MGQAALARRMTEKLGRSIDRAAVNKMTKGTRDVSADEMLAVMEITGATLPQQFADLVAQQARPSPPAPHEATDEEEAHRVNALRRRALTKLFREVFQGIGATPAERERLASPRRQLICAELLAGLATAPLSPEAVLADDTVAQQLVRAVWHALDRPEPEQ